jgi:hypothetical protein
MQNVSTIFNKQHYNKKVNIKIITLVYKIQFIVDDSDIAFRFQSCPVFRIFQNKILSVGRTNVNVIP